jgi:serine/threonine-protein phosphatase 6 regulatory ankyrin repeat subunit B
MQRQRTGLIAIIGCVAALAVQAASGASPLADAVMYGDDAGARALLRLPVNVNEPQVDGATALHWAVFRDDVELVRLLLSRGADAHARNNDGASALSLAATNGDPKVIALLLAAGADANERLGHGETPLMFAARSGRVEAIQVLLDHGAKVNAVESLRGTTALMWAASNRNAAAVRLLTRHGADASLASAAAPLGHQPYLAETAKDRIEADRLGVGQAGRAVPVNLDGDEPDPPEAAGLAADVIAAASGTGVPAPTGVLAPRKNDTRGGGLTALVFAVREGDTESVKALLAAGADVNQVTHYGWTALLVATQNRHYQLGKLLLEKGADPRIANQGGWTPLYIATDNRNIEGGDYPTRKPDMDHLEYIRLLLDKGAEPNARMHSSTETRTIFTHQWLHENGATAFLRAAQSGDLVLMKLLLQRGAEPKLVTDHGVTPLMVAAGIGWVEGVTFEWSPQQTLDTVRFLIDLGADVNARDIVDGRTALMGAAHKGRNDVVQLLVEHGADLATRDIGSRDSIHKLAGTTWMALDYADGLVRIGVQSAIPHPDTAKLIRSYMAARNLPVPPEGRTLDSICLTQLCK